MAGEAVRHHEFDIFGQEVAFGGKPLGNRARTRLVVRARKLDGSKQREAHEHGRLQRRTVVGVAWIPAGVAAEGNLDVRQADAGDSPLRVWSTSATKRA